MRSSYDVAVIGAGPAGVAASAAASARLSSGPDPRVLLVEASARLGGSVTAAMHRSLCGLYSRQPRDPLETLNAGVQRELVALMLEQQPADVRSRQMGKAWVLEFPTSVWESSLLKLAEVPGIERCLNTRVTEVRRKDNRIEAIRLGGQSEGWVQIAAVVDCSGGGFAMQAAGEDTLMPPDEADARMLGGYAVRLAGINADPELLRFQMPYALARQVDAGALPPTARFTMFYPGPDQGQGVCKLAIDVRELSADEARRFAERIVACLKREIPGLANTQIVEHSPRILPRLGRRLRGRSILNEKDVLESRQWGPDAVHAWWPIETWDLARGPSYVFAADGASYDVSPDCLRSAEVENLLAAGTCVSASSGAAASVRAGGICLATGAAAGQLAAELVAGRGRTP